LNEIADGVREAIANCLRGTERVTVLADLRIAVRSIFKLLTVESENVGGLPA